VPQDGLEELALREKKVPAILSPVTEEGASMEGYRLQEAVLLGQCGGVALQTVSLSWPVRPGDKEHFEDTVLVPQLCL
jgi:hypothetical protein